jgi:hypothetical protein
MAKRKTRKLGDILKIDLRDGKYAFGRVLEDPLCAFYDLHSETVPDLNYIISRPVLFKIWVMNYFKDAGWEVIGNHPLEAALEVVPKFWKQDLISKKLSLYRKGEEWPATVTECEGFENAAVWSTCHVEDRLRDHFAGRKNKWVESLKIKPPPAPPS